MSKFDIAYARFVAWLTIQKMMGRIKFWKRKPR